MNWKTLLTSFFAGVIFAVGLCISGMTDTGKVQGFLDILGAWDPSLMFVMVGAIAVYALSYHFWLKKKSQPYFAEKMEIPKNSIIDKRLLIGAAIFGIGWGLAGFCPGPALVSLVSQKSEVWTFVLAMIGGMLVFDLSLGRGASKI